MGQYDKAIIYFEKSIELNPKFNEPYLALSVIQLINKDFFNGWKNYEHRWNRPESPKLLNFDKPKWKPELGFKKILIWGEQGIGDQILFSNILSDLVKKFEKVFLIIDVRLKEIYELSFPLIEVVSNAEEINKEKFDYHLPIGSLGLYFKQDISQFNPKAPLFKISNTNNFRRNSKLRCAISWKSTNKDFGKSKSIKLLEMVEILKFKNIEFFNIQYSDESLEINELLDKEEIIINNVNELDTYNDINGLVSLINSCDFTITVSNTNAHLSAALGKPTYLLLPNEVGKFWYWENEINGKNIWYPSIKKFKQSESYNWSQPIRELKEYLKQKRENHKSYKILFSKFHCFELMDEKRDSTNNFWLETVIIKKEYIKYRKLMFEIFFKNNIFIRPVWKCISNQNAFKNCKKMNLKNSINLEKRIFNLPSSYIE